ncbi:TPA: hypothetical protein DDW35_09065, partial [Candidatus Sumerlaeota bacterium]|nr:hypothetical protein [Candidatus Sumerlaeota bacterium]
MKRMLIAGCMIFAFFLSLCAFAQEKTIDQLTEESVAKCKETASTKPTAAMIVEKVTKACTMIEKDGESAFSKFRGKDSEFIFAGTY